MKTGRLFLLFMVLGLIGCAGGKERVAAPREEIKVHFYVGSEELSLKKSPEYGSADVGKVKLNERVEKVEYGQAGWFQVRTADGRQGWINERYLKVDPVSEFFVRRWGVRLKAGPEASSKTLSRLRVNDQVKLLEKTPQGWAKVTVARTQETGWLEIRELSVERVVIRPVRRRPAKAAKEATEGGEEPTEAPETEEPQPSAPGLLAPSPAKAEPIPVKPEPSPVKEAPGPRKVKSERFEPF